MHAQVLLQLLSKSFFLHYCYIWYVMHKILIGLDAEIPQYVDVFILDRIRDYSKRNVRQWWVLVGHLHIPCGQGPCEGVQKVHCIQAQGQRGGLEVKLLPLC